MSIKNEEQCATDYIFDKSLNPFKYPTVFFGRIILLKVLNNYVTMSTNELFVKSIFVFKQN